MYCYVCRWEDDAGIPHYFGIYSEQPTIEAARRNIRFNMLDADPQNIVYQAIDEADMFRYLADVCNNELS